MAWAGTICVHVEYDRKRDMRLVLDSVWWEERVGGDRLVMMQWRPEDFRTEVTELLIELAETLKLQALPL